MCGAAPSCDDCPVDVPDVQYARSGDVDIAYQVVGEGPRTLVFVQGWVSNIEWAWQEPSLARFLRRLASFSRLIMFDKRGTGLSDRVAVDDLPTLELRMDDVRAVMDAAGAERAALLSVSEGCPMCILFATTYPQRTDALVMLGGYARRLWAEDYPFGATPEAYEGFLQSIQDGWGGAVGIEAKGTEHARRRALSDMVGDIPAHERDPRRRLRADPDERRHRRQACAADRSAFRR